MALQDLLRGGEHSEQSWPWRHQGTLMQGPSDVRPVRASVRISRVCACARLWTHVLLPCGCSPQLSLCPSSFLAPEEAEEQILPSEGWLRFKTTGLSGPPPVFPSPPSLHIILHRPITRQLVQPFNVDLLSHLRAPALWVR